jgi:hypothetical protein
MNDSLANFCHSCFAILVPTGGPDLAPGDAGYASGRIEPIQPTPMPSSQQAQPVQPTPYSPFPAQPPQTPTQTPMAWQPSSGSSSRRRRAGWPVGIFVLIFIVIRLITSGILSSAFSSSNSEPPQANYTPQGSTFSGPLPNNVGAYQKVQSGKQAKAANTYSSKTDPSGTGAVYVGGSNAAFVVATLPSLAGYPPADLLGVLTSGFNNKGSAGSALGATTTSTTPAGATIACAPIVATGTPFANVCAMKGPATAVVFSIAGDAKATMDFSTQLANAI